VVGQGGGSTKGRVVETERRAGKLKTTGGGKGFEEVKEEEDI
jgi:hypothetical protein